MNRQLQQQLQEQACRQNQQPCDLPQRMQPGQQQYPQQDHPIMNRQLQQQLQEQAYQQNQQPRDLPQRMQADQRQYPQQDHPIMNRQLQQQLQEQAYRQNQQPSDLPQGMQPGQQQYPQQPIFQPIQQPVIPQQPAVRQAGIQHGQQPAMQHTHQPGIRAQHGQQPVIQHGAMQPGQQPGMQHGAMQAGQQPDAQQMGRANPQTPQSKRPLNPLTPQENVLLQSIEIDISEAAAEVRSEVFTSMSSVESTPSGDEPISLPQDPNLVCPMCKRQFKIGQIQSYRAHVDTCTG